MRWRMRVRAAAVRAAERDLAQHGILGGGDVRLDEFQDDVLVALIVAPPARYAGSPSLVQPVRLGAVEDRRVERDPQTADVHRAGADGQVAAAGAGHGVAVVRGPGRADDVEQFGAALLGRGSMPLLVLLGLEGDAALLRRDVRCTAGRGRRTAVLRRWPWPASHGFAPRMSTGGMVNDARRLSPTGRYSWSLISSERSLTAAPSRQKTPISEPSWLPDADARRPGRVGGQDRASAPLGQLGVAPLAEPAADEDRRRRADLDATRTCAAGSCRSTRRRTGRSRPGRRSTVTTSSRIDSLHSSRWT